MKEQVDVVNNVLFKNRPFTDFKDFLIRFGHHLHHQGVRILIKAGCFEGVIRGLSRPSLMWQALRKTPTLLPRASGPHSRETPPLPKNPHAAT